MDSSAIFKKTAKGVEEVRTRKNKLSRQLRTILILIDGFTSVADLEEAAVRLGAPQNFMMVLEQQVSSKTLRQQRHRQGRRLFHLLRPRVPLRPGLKMNSSGFAQPISS